MTQLVVVPSTTKNVVDANGLPSRNFQFWMSGISANAQTTQGNVTTLQGQVATLQGQVTALQAQIVFPAGGLILWPNASPIPAGWVDTGDTITGTGVGGVYKIISHP